jgi:hypothetical protein
MHLAKVYAVVPMHRYAVLPEASGAGGIRRG